MIFLYSFVENDIVYYVMNGGLSIFVSVDINGLFKDWSVVFELGLVMEKIVLGGVLLINGYFDLV